MINVLHIRKCQLDVTYFVEFLISCSFCISYRCVNNIHNISITLEKNKYNPLKYVTRTLSSRCLWVMLSFLPLNEFSFLPRVLDCLRKFHSAFVVCLKEYYRIKFVSSAFPLNLKIQYLLYVSME